MAQGVEWDGRMIHGVEWDGRMIHGVEWKNDSAEDDSGVHSHRTSSEHESISIHPGRTVVHRGEDGRVHLSHTHNTSSLTRRDPAIRISKRYVFGSSSRENTDFRLPQSIHLS